MSIFEEYGALLGKFSRDILKYFSYFPQKIGFNIDYNQFCAFPNKAALKWLICATTE